MNTENEILRKTEHILIKRIVQTKFELQMKTEVTKTTVIKLSVVTGVDNVLKMGRYSVRFEIPEIFNTNTVLNAVVEKMEKDVVQSHRFIE